MHENLEVYHPADAEDQARYLVTSRLEIIGVLRDLIRQRNLVAAYFNDDNEMLLTALLDMDVDNNQVILDYGRNTEVNLKILRAEKITFVTAVNLVKIQFSSPGISLCRFEGTNAFAASLPLELLRFQRREYFRLATPVANPIKCHIPLPNGTLKEVTLADISAGGIGLTLPLADISVLEQGVTYPGCTIKLPEIGPITVTLMVRDTYEITLRNGSKCLHTGCEFKNVRPNIQSMIQRYINKLERERII
jgi:c-di-GMP-binding flagellar brake protein YcgR